MSESVRVGCETAEEIVKTWPEAAREAANEMMEEYGAPDEATASLLLWHNDGPWRRTVVYREEAQHNFPAPHRDVLEQFIPYRVPVDKFDDLAAFDGNVLVDRTKGLMSARCAGEGGNFLSLNLAYEIIQGNKDVESARAAYAQAMKARKEGNTPEIMQRLMFEIPRDDTADPDQALI
ncbi:MAG TPA: hypothetical protein VE597_05590 [Geminicoccaceae bacterium]|nr:hypothetical protein [Geminicoccaceae bacterium]